MQHLYIIIPISFRVVHCEKCNICVIKYDQPCPWTGKCIWKKNLNVFCILDVLYFHI